MVRQRSKTIADQRHGKPPGVDALVKIWQEDAIHTLLSYVWDAYDYVYANCLSQIPFTENYEDFERSVTQELERKIQDSLDRYLPYQVQHNPSERESRKPPPAMPPQYDIAFVLRSDPRIMWPLEAKVVRTDKDTTTNLGAYISEIQEQFLTCRYAPFSNGGAMLCYFKFGSVTTLLGNIEKRLGCVLLEYKGFSDRPHRVSEHTREVPLGKEGIYPSHFRCHHIIMSLFSQNQTTEDGESASSVDNIDTETDNASSFAA